jgi:hypothetical protein
VGADHSNVAGSLNNLGNVLYDLGELEAACHAHRHALAIFEAQPRHPSVAVARDNLARVLAALLDDQFQGVGALMAASGPRCQR